MERRRHTEDILDELKPEIKGKIENETSIQGRVPYTSIGNNYTLSINGRITDSLIAPHSKVISNNNTPHRKNHHRRKNLHPTINTKKLDALFPLCKHIYTAYLHLSIIGALNE